VGLKKFVEEGDIKLAGPQERTRNQMSPVMVGIFIAAVATTGGVLLTDAIDFGESITWSASTSTLDDSTKLYVQIGISLLLTIWLGTVILGFVRSVGEKIATGASAAKKAAISLAFWCVVLVLTYNLAKT